MHCAATLPNLASLHRWGGTASSISSTCCRIVCRRADNVVSSLRPLSLSNLVSRCGQDGRDAAGDRRQVADRFHLIQNLRLAIEQQLSYNDRPSRAVHNNNSTPRSDGLQLQERRRMIRIGRRNVRLERLRRVKELHQAGVNLNKIVEETGLGWRTVAKWLRLEVLPERRLMDPRPTNPARFPIPRAPLE